MALEGSYVKKSDEGSKSVVGGIAAGGNLNLSTGGGARLEGAQLKAGGDTDVDVKGNLKFDAARDTSRSESLNVEGSVTLGGASVKDTDKKEQTDTGMFGVKASGQYEKSADDKAVTGAIDAGGNLRLRAGGDAALEGTDLRAGKQASVSAGRDLDLKAASDFAESTKFSGELGIGGASKTTSALDKDGQATGGEKADTSSAGLALSGDYAKSETRRGSTVQAGAGGAQLSAGRDLAMESGSVKSGGDAGLTAGGDINLKTATSNANSIGGSLQAGRESARDTANTDKDSTESKLGAGVRGVTSQSHEGTAINSGGQIKIQSGGQTSMSNTGTNAARGTVTEAARGVTTTTVKDRKDILNMGASKKSETGGTPVAPAPKAPWKAATPAGDGGAAKPADAAKVKAQGPVIGDARKQAAAKKSAKEVKPFKTAKPVKPVKPVKPMIGQARKPAAAPSQ